MHHTVEILLSKLLGPHRRHRALHQIQGALRGQVRLAGSFWASPILVDDTIVAANKEGKTFLVSVAGEPTILSENELPGTFTATPAVADGSLYLRSETALWKVAAP